ncbi:MAG: ThuA domain-containing protein [Phycisphaerales bacterium]|nr:ThuA domain-containing protein [Phycisphaerales bacterium]
MMMLILVAAGLLQAETHVAVTSEPQVLVFSRTAGFRHGSIEPGVKAMQSLGGDAFTVVHTEDPGRFTHDGLASFDAVVFLNTTMDVLDDAQQQAFAGWYRDGGGYVGIHAAADTEYDWPWYGQLMGAWFMSHPSVQEADIVVEDRTHPAMSHLPATWTCTDEWYDYRASPRGSVHVLARMDHDSYEGEQMEGDHPVIWCQVFDGGTAFYTGRGHTDESFAEPAFREHLRQAILWVIDDGWIELVPEQDLGQAWRQASGWINVHQVMPHESNPRDFHSGAASESKAVKSPGVLVNHGEDHRGDLVSAFEHGDAEVHVEFMVPEGSNSGVYLQGRYEIQILDSHGKAEPRHDDCGGIYQRWDESREPHGYEGTPPRVNAARRPFQWQSYDIIFRAPRFDAEGVKISNARFERVVHNGQVLHEDVELSGPTRGGFADEVPVGPLRLQGDHGPVAYRNVRIRPLGSAVSD